MPLDPTPPSAIITSEGTPPTTNAGVFDPAIFDPVIFDTGGGVFERDNAPPTAVVTME